MYERMLNKLEQPSYASLLKHCGSAADYVQSLHTFLSNTCKATQNIRFPYGNTYGWCLTYRKGKKLICNIFAEADACTLMLGLSDQQYAEVYEQLQSATRHLIDHKYPCGDGGYIHYRILSAKDVNDIILLLSIKCR